MDRLFKLTVIFLFFVRDYEAFQLYRLQSVGIRGTIQCAGRPLPDIKVDLIDYDEPDPNDLMATGVTSSNGSFLLEGHESEITYIDPVLIIYHRCNDGGIPCERKWWIRIPNKYITFGDKKPKAIMNLGIVNAEVILDKETRDCLH